ncbi:cornifelin homolog B [Oryzias latipes]|uniref:Plac8 onzin related protein 6 n=1 Tax=Oryzias latipes TaxID=8090 RepID=A0A3B3IFU6_ORYLA|nr:cornifelin homolog B [Oryzias latipes]
MSHKSSEWNSGLLSCCDDMNSCCYGFWCCPCLACTVAGSFGENRCLPLCDICSPTAFSSFGIPLCVPPAGLSLRVGIRHMYGIKGSLCRDIATSCFCVWCNWCQMHRELKIRNRDTSVVIKQPTPAVSK